MAGERTLYALPGIMQGLRACLEVFLEDAAANGGPPKPQYIEVRPAGPEAAPYISTTEEQCKCGMAWVMLTGVELAEPGEDGAVRNADGDLCGPQQWTATLQAGVQRCPVLGTAQRIPTPEESLADALTQLADQRTVLRAIRCCFGDGYAQPEPSTWTPIPPEGMCFGGFWTFSLTLDDCDENCEIGE